MVLSMERWVGKVAIVTGASAGIGAAIVKQLVKNGMIVAGLARRQENVQQLAKELEGLRGQLHAVKCDISKEQDILNAFKWVTQNLGPVHVLVNNAGVADKAGLINGDTQGWRKIFDINVIGKCIATREAVCIMNANNVSGHIIHINSLVGHRVLPLPELSVYSASKHAVTALSESLQVELALSGQKNAIKVTSISPGATETEMLNTLEIREKLPANILAAEDIADGLIYALSTPPQVQITELTMKSIEEMF